MDLILRLPDDLEKVSPEQILRIQDLVEYAARYREMERVLCSWAGFRGLAVIPYASAWRIYWKTHDMQNGTVEGTTFGDVFRAFLDAASEARAARDEGPVMMGDGSAEARVADELDWEAAKRHLRHILNGYAWVEKQDMPNVDVSFAKAQAESLADRVDAGERTHALHEQIMALKD